MTLPATMLAHDRQGSGMPLLLLHGALVNRDYWQPHLPRFAAGYDVIRCDLPGHGEMPALAETTSIKQMAEAVIATLDQLDIAETLLLGHSLGGMIAQELVRRAPNRVRALILAETWCYPHGEIWEPFPFRTAYLHWALRMTAVPWMTRFMANGLGRYNPDIPSYARSAMARYDHERANFLRIWNAATDFDSRAWLGQITCPTLVLTSTSYPFTAYQARLMQRAIPGAELVEISRSSHWLNWDNPSEFEDAVFRFFNSPEVRRIP
jgi:pimeloyl-ACP methyl ester carboxylesterase